MQLGFVSPGPCEECTALALLSYCTSMPATCRPTPLAACFCRDNAANQQRKRHALVFWTGRRLALAFTAWQDYAIRKQLTGDKLQRAAAFWSKQALAAAFYGWIEGEAPSACWLPRQAVAAVSGYTSAGWAAVSLA